MNKIDQRSVWPADSVKRRKVAELIPYARNARTHSPEQVAQIAASIREWGFTNPVLVDAEDGIIAGHGRVLAAQQLGLADVPTMVAAGWTEAQKRAYIITDNKLALNAGWDMEVLAVEFGDLAELDFDLSLTGFGEDELANLMIDKTEGLTDPDEIPDAPEAPVSVAGDTWLLGKHRLRCGDSTSADDVAALCGDHQCDMVFTSPPYAQQRDYGAAKEAVQDWDVLMNGVFSILPVKDGAQVLVNLGMVHDKGRVNAYWNGWIEYMNEAGWPLFAWYVWDQGSGMPGNWNGRLAPSHEFVFHFATSASQSNKWVDKKPENIKAKKSDKGAFRQKDGSLKPIYSGAKYAQPTKVADSVIRVNRAPSQAAKSGHPATFPTKLCEYIYNSFGKIGDLFYEPFCGSGTAIIACETFGAHCRGMELDAVYCDTAVIRWQNFTGQDATLESTGETFRTTAAKRGGK